MPSTRTSLHFHVAFSTKNRVAWNREVAPPSPLHQRLHQGGNWMYSGLKPGGRNGDPGGIHF
jgi:hypothetical protein